MCLLLAAPHHNIPHSGNVRFYATYLQLRCGLRPTPARQAMQIRAIKADLANQPPEMSGRQPTAIRHITAPLPFALLPTRDAFLWTGPIASAAETPPAWSSLCTVREASSEQAYSPPQEPTPVAIFPPLDLTRVYA